MTKRSIAKVYIYLTSIAAVIASILSIAFTIYNFTLEKKKLIIDTYQAASKIESTIKETFDYSENLARFIGKNIVEQGYQNHKKIAEILNGEIITNEITKNTFSYTIFDWVDKDKRMIISGPYGILSEPKDVSFRNYSKLAPQKQWKLHFDLPANGITSYEYIIPAGMGIADTKGNFLGILTMGFNLKNLNRIINSKIKDSKIQYIVFSNERDLILQSKEDLVTNFAELKTKLNHQQKFEGNHRLDNEIIHNGVKYIFYKRFVNYPYIVLVGYDLNSLNREIYEKLLPRLTESVMIALVFIGLYLISRKKLLLL